jgi:hypothetical protein
MAHKALIGGTAYEISGGKTLVDGTAYSIKNGKTLVGGTAYEVGFGGEMAIVTLKGDMWSDSYSYAEIYYTTPDGEYGQLSTAGKYELPIGSSVSVDLGIENDNYHPSVSIYFNGELKDSTSYSHASHSFSITQNVVIAPTHQAYSGGIVAIAEIPDGCISFIHYDGANTVYVAENGMMWNEWCDSEYNNFDGYKMIKIDGDAVTYLGTALTYNGTNVKPTDTIIDDATYSTY